MEVIIKTCPACEQLLLDESGICPGCGYELSPGTAQPLPRNDLPVHQPGDRISCRRCGSMVPKASVHCPDCGTLMQLDRYGKRPAGSSGGEAGNGNRAGALGGARMSTAQIAEDPDFDLMSDVQMVEDTGLMRDLNSQTQFGSEHGPTTADDLGDFEISSDVSLVHDPDAGTPTAYQLNSGGLAELPPEEQGNYDAAVDNLYSDDQSYADDGSQEYPVAGADGYGYADPGAEGSGELPADDGYAQQDYPPAEGEYPPADAAYATGDEPPPVDESVEPPQEELSPEDALYAAALQEEAEAGKRPKNRRGRRELKLASDAFLVYCPNGHKIVVRETHRGRLGRCPNCKQPFFVPTESVTDDVPETAAQAGTLGSEAIGLYSDWIRGARMNIINPAKLKLKDGSLVGTHDVIDIGFAPDHALVAVIFPGNTAFRSMVEAKKTDANRAELRSHLAASGGLDQAPCKLIRVTPDQFPQMRIVQPPIPGDETIFAGIPVFGPGRVAIRFPTADGASERGYLSFTLSQFREFLAQAKLRFGVEAFSPVPVVPLEDEYEVLTCHYSDTPIHALKHLEFYQQDPATPLQLLGWKCEGCGLIVSEDSRKKEKIGGKSESSVPKAKCPKCKKKFGDQRLYALKVSAAAATT